MESPKSIRFISIVTTIATKHLSIITDGFVEEEVAEVLTEVTVLKFFNLLCCFRELRRNVIGEKEEERLASEFEEGDLSFN